LRNADIEELFEWVPIKTPVKIIGPKGKVRRALKYTSSGPDVVTLQLRLQQLGFYGGRADGLYGKTTEEAVRNYQSEYGLEPNGMVDLKLARRLGI
jgi:peptidoglycan hydrolase-like protein with peptidoglycan-binding domain